MGSLYRPKLKSGRRSDVWWAEYYANGRPVRESTGVSADTKTPPAEARRILKEREGRIAAGIPVLPRADRVRYEEAAADLRRHYQTTGSRDLDEAEGRLKLLDPFFAARRLASIGQADAARHVEQRQGEGAANGTINRELAVLGRICKIAYEGSKLFRLPVLRKLKEAGPRHGFFEQDHYLAVRAKLPDDLQVAVVIEHTYGWRCQSEVLTLERRQLDLEAGTLRLDPGAPKNDDGRIVYLTPELVALLRAQLERVRACPAGEGGVRVWALCHLRSRGAPVGLGARARRCRAAEDLPRQCAPLPRSRLAFGSIV